MAYSRVSGRAVQGGSRRDGVRLDEPRYDTPQILASRAQGHQDGRRLASLIAPLRITSSCGHGELGMTARISPLVLPRDWFRRARNRCSKRGLAPSLPGRPFPVLKQPLAFLFLGLRHCREPFLKLIAVWSSNAIKVSNSTRATGWSPRRRRQRTSSFLTLRLAG